MVSLTPKAAQKIIALAGEQGKPPILRLKVGAGGCSGMSYQFEISGETQPGDIVFEGHGAKAVVDPRSDFFVGGSEVDWHETLMEARFTVQNPLAKSACSCGVSFST